MIPQIEGSKNSDYKTTSTTLDHPVAVAETISKTSTTSQNILRRIVFGSDISKTEGNNSSHLTDSVNTPEKEEEPFPLFNPFFNYHFIEKYYELEKYLSDAYYHLSNSNLLPERFYTEKNKAWEEINKHINTIRYEHPPDKSKQLVRIPLHHQRPLADPFDNKITQEIESLSVEIRLYFHRMRWFFLSSCIYHLEPDQLKIIDYLDGTISIDQLGLTKQNALKYLIITKITDLAITNDIWLWRSRIVFKNSSYAIRCRILELLSPEIQTTDVFTKAIDPQKLQNDIYLKDSKNWITERIGLYAKHVIPIEYTHMLALSNLLQQTATPMFVVRGTTAAGKTTFLRKKFVYALDENGNLRGSINCDTMKYLLRLITSENMQLFNTQVHQEVTKGPLNNYKETLLRKTHLSLIVDARLSLPQELESLANGAQVRKGKPTFVDIDIDLTHSLLGALQRHIDEKDPCPRVKAIVTAWIESRKCRAAVAQKAFAEGYRYELYHRKNNGDLQLVLSSENELCLRTDLKLLKAEATLDNDVIFYAQLDEIHGIGSSLYNHAFPYFLKREGITPTENLLKWDFALKKSMQFHVIKTSQTDAKIEMHIENPITSLECFDEIHKIPDEFAIEKIINQTITPQLVQEMGFSPSDNLSQWVGFSLKNAVEFHAMKITPNEGMARLEEEKQLMKLYGTYRIQPFTGSWLSDYPQIKEHLDSEHLLHVRGTDDKGKGFTWETNKFASKLNPQFNPEAYGGFQMKLGYFIVRNGYFEKFTAESLSSSVLNDLEVKNEEGELEGYRFFVHPEAYSHFRELHDHFKFVAPEKSEFIGTPTSTYRSWAIRRIVDIENEIKPYPDSIPFIVKMGVANESDTSRLITSEEIERSIKTQNHYNNMKIKSKLMLFQENLGFRIIFVPYYPPAPPLFNKESVDSGLIIREFPKELLEGEVKILSFSALMSMERTHEQYHGLGAINDSDKRLKSLPLIYEIIDKTIKKGHVQTPFEFIQKYFIDEAFDALEPYIFQEGLSLPLHAQNLCLVLNNDGTPKCLALRDHGDVHKTKRFIETYTWFYRYHVFIKLLNVLVQHPKEQLPNIPGSPFLKGGIQALEKGHYPYLRKLLIKNFEDMDAINEIDKFLERMSISFEDYKKLLGDMDQKYFQLLSKYFDMQFIDLSLRDLKSLAVEINSEFDNNLLWVNKLLFSAKRFAQCDAATEAAADSTPHI